MGITILHATAIVVPVAAGFILNYTGYQVPFYIACGFALVNFVVTLRLDPVKQRCAARVAADEAAALAGRPGGRRVFKKSRWPPPEHVTAARPRRRAVAPRRPLRGAFRRPCALCRPPRAMPARRRSPLKGCVEYVYH